MIEIDEMIEFLTVKKSEGAKIDRNSILKDFELFKLNTSYGIIFAKIATVISTETGISIESMKLKTSITEIALARHLTMYFLRKKTNLSPPMVGLLFSTKRHTFDRHTVNWGVRKIESYYEVDKGFRKQFDKLELKVDKALNQDFNLN